MTPCASDWARRRDSIAAMASPHAGPPGEAAIATMLSCSSWNTHSGAKAASSSSTTRPHRVQREPAGSRSPEGAEARTRSTTWITAMARDRRRSAARGTAPARRSRSGRAGPRTQSRRNCSRSSGMLRSQLLARPGEVLVLAARAGQLRLRPREHGGEHVLRHRLQHVLEDLELQRALRVLELVVARSRR